MTSPLVLGLLPARGGSKGIPGKNLRPLLGRPLIGWVADALAKARTPARKICSTDDLAIAEVAKAFGLEIPWMRPAELAQDRTLVVDVILHALEVQPEPFTHVALVQATSPTVTSMDIDAAVELALTQNADTVITGFAAGQRHPTTMYTVDQNGEVHWLLDQKQRMARRQELAPVFVRTGLVYVLKADNLHARRSIYGGKIVALTIEESRAVTIDEEDDFQLAAFLMEKCGLQGGSNQL